MFLHHEVGEEAGCASVSFAERVYEEQFGEPAPANMIVGYIDVAWQLVEKGAGYVCCFVPENYDGRGRLFLTPMLHRDGTPVCRNTWFFYPGEKNISETQQ